MKYMPYNEETARQFEQSMEANMLYRSTDNFIAIYNNQLINRSNDEIDKVAKTIEKVYKNISLVNRQFIVKSNEEVISDEFEILFPHVSFVATLKRIGEDILKENYPEDTRMVFTEDEPHYVLIDDPTSEDDAKRYEGAERINKAAELVSSNPFILNNIELEEYGPDGIAFKIVDLLTIDTSFIEEIGALLNAYLNEDDNEQEQY